MPLLEARGLSASYGSSPALAGVDFTVPADTMVGVLGANGAGKSTLLRTVAGLVRPSAGTIVFDGRRIDALPPHAIAGTGLRLVPEGRGIFPALTVADNLAIALRGQPDAVSNMLERFPALRDRSDQPAGLLSGGEQQMLAFARAFGDHTRLLLVDEPSLGLAPRLVATIEDTLRYLHMERGRTIVWVEQYASRVLRLADVVYILARGKVVWAGEPSELRASPVLMKAYLGGAA